MVWLGFTSCLHVRLIHLCKHLIVNWTPAVVFKTHVPAIVLILLRLVKMHIDCLLARFFLHLHVVARCKSIHVNDTAMHKDLVEDEGWELRTAQTEAHMALGGCIEEPRLRRINRLQQIMWRTPTNTSSLLKTYFCLKLIKSL